MESGVDREQQFLAGSIGKGTLIRKANLGREEASRGKDPALVYRRVDGLLCGGGKCTSSQKLGHLSVSLGWLPCKAKGG
jgi:hypothetical protein